MELKLFQRFFHPLHGTFAFPGQPGRPPDRVAVVQFADDIAVFFYQLDIRQICAICSTLVFAFGLGAGNALGNLWPNASRRWNAV
jgi:hypothetical protein